MRYAARVFIKNSDGLFLVMNQIKQGMYLLPGGKKELNESLEDCAVRETKEETNLDIQNLRLIYKCSWSHNLDPDGVTVAFFAADADLSKLKIMEPQKHLDYKFMTIEELARQSKHLGDMFLKLKSRLSSKII